MSAAATAAGYLYASGKMRGRGRECGKRRYNTELEAMGSAEHRTADAPPLRAYVCTSCHGWHLTKQVKRA